MYPCRYWWLSPSVNVEPDRSYIVLSFAKIEGKLLPSAIAIELTDDQQDVLRQTSQSAYFESNCVTQPSGRGLLSGFLSGEAIAVVCRWKRDVD